MNQGSHCCKLSTFTTELSRYAYRTDRPILVVKFDDCLSTTLFLSLFTGDQQFTYWLTYFFILQLALCISVQMIYLNRALDTFNTSVVTPIYYVFFTTFVIIASAVLFKVSFIRRPLPLLLSVDSHPNGVILTMALDI